MLKRLFCCLACIAALLCAASALAAPAFAPASFDLSNFVMPAGVRYAKAPAYDAENGILTFTIDSAATDWYQVVSSGYDAGSGDVNFTATLINPYGDDSSYKAITSSTAPDEYLQNKIAKDDWNTKSAAGNHFISWAFGRYDAAKQLFVPYEPEDADCSVVFGWNEGADVRRVRIRPRFTDLSPQSADISLLPAQNIQEHTDSALNQKITAGNVRYTLQNSSAQEITTSFTLPKVSDDQTGWSVSCAAASITTGENGVYSISTSVGTDSVNVATYVIEHLDDSKAVQAVYSLTVTIEQGDVRLWPEYIAARDDKFQPVPKNRIRVRMSEDFPGVSASYDAAAGHLRLAIDAESFVPTAKGNLAELTALASITPPEGAKFMSFRGTGGEIIYGDLNPSDYDQPDPYMPVETVSWDAWEEGYPAFREVPYQGGEKSYFTSPIDYTGEYSGMVGIYYWFKASENDPTKRADTPFLIEYIARTYDPVTLETTVPVIGDESELDSSNAGKPFIVIQDKGFHTNAFYATMYPTGVNTHYYELKVLAPNNKEVPLGGAACRLYLPYPPGYNMQNVHLLNISINHYNKSGSVVTEHYSLQNGNLIAAPSGLCITVTSLSPFTVEWTEAADADLPQTGDSARPLLWLSLLSLAAFCLKRRVRHA